MSDEPTQEEIYWEDPTEELSPEDYLEEEPNLWTIYALQLLLNKNTELYKDLLEESALFLWDMNIKAGEDVKALGDIVGYDFATLLSLDQRGKFNDKQKDFFLRFYRFAISVSYLNEVAWNHVNTILLNLLPPEDVANV